MCYRLYIILLFSMLIGSVTGQEKLGELAVSEPELLNQVVRSPDRAVLQIVSEVLDLQFESTRQILEIRQPSASEWQVFVEPGRQILTIRARGYQPIDTKVMTLQAKRAYGLKVTQVKPIPGTLVIRTIPDSASLRINGAPIDARTPFTNNEALPGDYYVQIDKPGYRPAGKTLNVESSKITTWEFELVQTAVRVQINIENDLEEVGILIDDKAVGIAPGSIYLEPGSYRLMLQKDGYKYGEKVIDIALGPEELVLTEKLQLIRKPLFTRWWFLTGSAAALTGGAFLILGGSGQSALSPLPEAPDFPDN